MRLAWHDVWGEVARTVAKRSRCARQQNGCVIVSPENKVVATGYNGPPARWWPGTEVMLGQNTLLQDCPDWCERGREGPTEVTRISYEDCPSLHAEANALMYSDASARKDGTIFITSDPCWQCSKLIANSGLANVVIVEGGGDRGYRDPERNYAFLEASGIRVFR